MPTPPSLASLALSVVSLNLLSLFPEDADMPGAPDPAKIYVPPLPSPEATLVLEHLRGAERLPPLLLKHVLLPSKPYTVITGGNRMPLSVMLPSVSVSSMHTLILDNYDGLTDNKLAALLVASSAHLRRLSLARTGISDGAFTATPTRLPVLLHVNLMFCDRLTTRVLHAILRRAPQLSRIDTGSMAMETAKSDSLPAPDLPTFLTGKAPLSRITRFTAVRSSWLSCWSGELDALSVLLQAMPSLTKLDVSGCPGILCDAAPVFGDDPRTGALLEEVRLVCCRDVMADPLIALVRGLPKLRSLRIDGCHAISGRDVLTMCEIRPTLTDLHLAELDTVTDPILGLMAAQLPRLRSLDLSWCYRVTDEGLALLAPRATGIERLILRKLDISSAGIDALASHCTSLRSIDLSHCDDIENASLLRLVLANGATLRKLKVAWLMNIDDETVQRIWAACPHLETVDFEGCKRLTSDLLPPPASLRLLSLVSVDSVSDSDLEALVRRRPGLRIVGYYGAAIAV